MGIRQLTGNPAPQRHGPPAPGQLAASDAVGPHSLTEALDEAPLSWFHLKALLTAGMGFFTDAYDLFIIGVVMALIKGQWHLSTVQVSLLGSATLLATLLGAVIFGRVADLYGRKAVYGLEAGIMVVAALGSALAPSFAWLVACRFVLGLGIGGDYPVSGVIISEYANRANRGLLVSLVFSMQAAGLVIGPMVALTLLASGLGHALAWRLMLGLGALPALSVLYLRRTLPESPRFLAHVRGDAARAAASIERYSGGVVRAATTSATGAQARRDVGAFFTSRRTLLLLLGTAGSWFLLDYAYYGNTISTPLILAAVAPGAGLIRSAAWSLIIFAVAALPGYAAAVVLIDRVGHRRLQWVGFTAMGLALLTIGLVPGVTRAIVPFLIAYGLSYFFTECGPNVTTFVIPTEVFAAGERATGHGVAAGVGKLGAFIGVFLVPLLTSALGLNGTLLIAAGAAFAGALLTLVLPEPSGRSLEDVSHEVALADAS